MKENYLKVFFNEIIFIQCEYKNLHHTAKKIFETDVDISAKKKPLQIKKQLVAFQIGENEQVYQGNLDEDDGEWNQFELNKKKYNVSSSYNENNYTTKLDPNLIPQEHKIKAEKIIKEIYSNSNNATNIHVLEDRGLVTECEIDEEDKYSSVMRQKPPQGQ